MERDTTNDKSITWNSDTTYALGLYKILMNILGIWPPKSLDVFSKIHVAGLAFLPISMMIGLIIETNSACSSSGDVAEMISLIGCTILALLKIVILCAYRPKMLEVIASAVIDWANVKSSKAHCTMRKHAKLARFVFIFQMTSAYVTTLPLIIGALPFLAPQVNVTGTNETSLRVLPIPSSCIFSDIPDVFYPIIFIIQSLQLLTTCTANIGTDVYFFGIAMHLCGQYKLLGDDFENFSINVDKSAERENLVELIRRHVRLGELAQYLEDSFNFIILGQVSANSLLLCLMGIRIILSLKSGDTVIVVNTAIIFYVMTLQLFLYCYAGDRLSSQVANLHISAYFSPWYEMPPSLARDVRFIITRNHKNFNITAGTIYRIDIDNFKNLIKALASYFSVLRMMFDA